MNPRQVVIVCTGSANLASVAVAFERLGIVPRVSEDAALVKNAPLVVLPGVGAFGAAMAHLRARGLDNALRERVERNRPLLGICLGMQLLCESSEESPGVAGLGIAPGRITRFGPTVRVPQMGWNTITPTTDQSLLQPSWMYFANSFRLERIPSGWSGSISDHGGPFASAIQRGPLLACQFHPELSGPFGVSLIDRWLSLASGKVVASC